MIRAVFQIMWLRLWRDKGALLLAFILPGFIFAIFAAIFSNASGGELDLRASISVTTDVPASVAFARRLKEDAPFTLTDLGEASLPDVRDRVRLGQDDVALLIDGDITQSETPSLTIIGDPSREVATTVFKGQLRQMLADYSGLQSQNLFSDVSALEATETTGPVDQSVTYYIGATAVLFLLFSAMQGASLSLEERNSGISDRLLIGQSQTLRLFLGKFLFLTVIGCIQALIIACVASGFFQVDILSHLPGLVLAILGTACLSSSLALLIASLCNSAAQMHAVSTFTVLLFSAVGGSMVPRFMMPDWLQSIGRFTPNHWSIEAFYGTLARGQTLLELGHVWVILFGASVVALIGAAVISHRLMRI